MGQQEQAHFTEKQQVEENIEHVDEQAQHVEQQAQHVEVEADMIVATIRQGGVSVSYTAASNMSSSVSNTTSPSWPQPDILESQTRFREVGSLPKTPSVSPTRMLSRVSSPSISPLTLPGSPQPLGDVWSHTAGHWLQITGHSSNPDGSCLGAGSTTSATQKAALERKDVEEKDFNKDQTWFSKSGFRIENQTFTDQRQPCQTMLMSPRELLAKVNSPTTAFSLMPPPTPSPMPPSTPRDESSDSRRPSTSSGDESALQWSSDGFEYPAKLKFRESMEHRSKLQEVMGQQSLNFWEIMEPQVDFQGSLLQQNRKDPQDINEPMNEDYEDPDGDITPTPSPIYSDIYDSYGHRVEVETPCWDPSVDPMPWNNTRHWHSELISIRTPVPKKVKCSHKGFQLLQLGR